MLQTAQQHEWVRKRMRVEQRSAYVSGYQKVALRKCFESLDVDFTGLVDREELTRALAALGFASDTLEDEVRQIMACGDSNGDGELAFEEFVSLASRLSELRRGGEGELTGLEAIIKGAADFPLAMIANASLISRLVDACAPRRLNLTCG